MFALELTHKSKELPAKYQTSVLKKPFRQLLRRFVRYSMKVARLLCKFLTCSLHQTHHRYF
jgi:hypothetical protein